MKGTTNIAVNLAPDNWTAFKRWHKAACPSDCLTAQERWEAMGNKLPKKNVDKTNPRSKKKE